MTARKDVEDVLREADRRKDEFLATLSHELRNPLAPIRNALELLRRAGADESLRERALAITERQVQQLVRLTDDLLDVSRITRNKIELRCDRIDLRTAISGALETVAPLSDAAGHSLVVNLAGNAALGLRGPDAAGAGVREHPEQRREIHRSRRPISVSASAEGRQAVGGHVDRYRDRHRSGRLSRPSSTCSCRSSTAATVRAAASASASRWPSA